MSNMTTLKRHLPLETKPSEVRRPNEIGRGSTEVCDHLNVTRLNEK